MEDERKRRRLKILLAVLIISTIGLAAEYYFIKPYTEAKRGGGRGKSSPAIPSPTPSPSISASRSPSPNPSPSPATNLFSDDFSGTLGKWDIVYTGYGTVAIENGLLSMAPMVSKAPSETHAPLVAVNSNSWNSAWNDYSFSVKMNTTQQLRVGSTPNPWEVGWLLFRYADAQHFYYFIKKTNGIELGKFNNGSQTFFVTADNPKLTLNTWDSYSIAVKGNNIKVSVNGTQVANYTDTNSPYLTGRIGLYDEDTHVHYDDVTVASN